MDRQELGAFLRSRRERLRPEDVALPSGPRRRTPGLRREEVAVLAHISTEYYVRLEQGRAPRPSGEVLAGIAGALRLRDAESDHLHVLAGTAPTRTGLHRRDVRPSILALLERLPSTAAFVMSAAFEVLAWNDLAAALMEDFAGLAPEDRNLARKAFLEPARLDTALYGISDDAEFRHSVVMELRATLARYPSDPAVTGLVEELRGGSPEFARLWERHDVRAAPMLTKTFRHRAVGEITVDCDSLTLTDRDQRLVLYTAPQGSRDAEALALLNVLQLLSEDAVLAAVGADSRIYRMPLVTYLLGSDVLAIVFEPGDRPDGTGVRDGRHVAVTPPFPDQIHTLLCQDLWPGFPPKERAALRIEGYARLAGGCVPLGALRRFGTSWDPGNERLFSRTFKLDPHCRSDCWTGSGRPWHPRRRRAYRGSTGCACCRTTRWARHRSS